MKNFIRWDPRKFNPVNLSPFTVNDFAGCLPRPMPPPSHSVQPIEHTFKTTVSNIKKHLQQCDVQELVTNFNMVASKEKFPNFKDRVKEKLYKCKTIGDLFARISPFLIGRIEEYLKLLWRSQVAEKRLLS